MLSGFCRDSFGVLFCCGARLTIHAYLLDCVISSVSFLTVVVLECNISHRRSVAVYRVCCRI